MASANKNTDKNAALLSAPFLNELRVAPDSVEKGTKIYLGVENSKGEPIYLYVAPTFSANKEYTAMRAKEYAALREQKTPMVTNEMLKAVDCKIMAHTVLKDWEGWEDADRNEVKYTPEVGELLLREIPLVYEFVEKNSQILDLHTVASRESAAKN